MAQTGYTPIQLYYSTTATNIPSAANLVNGELALNIADMKLYAKNGSGVVTLLADAGGTAVPNSLTMNNSGAGAASGTTFNGSAPVTLSYNTIGAPKADGTGASGTWNINITGNAGGSAASATTATNLAGGATDQIPYQSSTGVTTFISAPTVPGRFLYWDNFSGFQWLAGAGLGTVTAVDVSGGTTGLTFSGGPINYAGTITMAGTLDVDNGGTGQTSYTNGELLIGNSTGNTLTKTTLTAGAGISITNGPGTITINAVSVSPASKPFAYFCGNF